MHGTLFGPPVGKQRRRMSMLDASPVLPDGHSHESSREALSHHERNNSAQSVGIVRRWSPQK